MDFIAFSCLTPSLPSQRIGGNHIKTANDAIAQAKKNGIPCPLVVEASNWNPYSDSVKDEYLGRLRREDSRLEKDWSKVMNAISVKTPKEFDRFVTKLLYCQDKWDLRQTINSGNYTFVYQELVKEVQFQLFYAGHAEPLTAEEFFMFILFIARKKINFFRTFNINQL